MDRALNQVYLQLHQLQRSRHFIEVQVAGDDVIYQSIMLSLDPDERTVLIDELFPTGFIGLAGQCVSVSIRQAEGRKLQFESVILESHSHDDVPLYVLAMPRSLDTDQRRASYRLAVNERAGIEPSFYSEQQFHRARARNLSIGGICLELDGDHSETWQRGDELQGMAFEFGGIQFDCDLAVRSVEADAIDLGEDCRTRLGVEFIDMPVPSQRLLEQSIMRAQRYTAKGVSALAEQLQ